MKEFQIMQADEDDLNRRILAMQAELDYKNIEVPSVKMRAYFTSAEAKQLFSRHFNSLQSNMHFVSLVARTKGDFDDIAHIEGQLLKHLAWVDKQLNAAIKDAEDVFKTKRIACYATYNTKPLECQVSLFSPTGRLYFEILNKFDQLMPLLYTLVLQHAITHEHAEYQRVSLRFAIRKLAKNARNLANRLKKRMKMLSAGEAAGEQAQDTLHAALTGMNFKQGIPGRDTSDDAQQEKPVQPQYD
jgi:hypothetical protein